VHASDKIDVPGTENYFNEQGKIYDSPNFALSNILIENDSALKMIMPA